MDVVDLSLSLATRAWKRLAGRPRSWWYKKSFLLYGKRYCAKFECGPGNLFYVPVRIDGCGTLTIGRGNSFGYRQATRLGSGEILLQPRSPKAEVQIGEANYFNNNVSIVANERVVMKDGCQVGDLVCIYDCDFHELNPATRNQSPGRTAPVTIGNNVWLGSRSLILKGVEIGDNSVIAPMSVVTRCIPSNSLAAGIPARVIRDLGQG